MFERIGVLAYKLRYLIVVVWAIAAVLSITFYLSPANALVPNVIWSREYRQRVPVA